MGYVEVAGSDNYTVIARWPLVNATGNYPMAYDQTDGTILIGTRAPPLLVILNQMGRQIANVSIPGDPDDVFYQPNTGCVYISSGEGFLTVV